MRRNDPAHRQALLADAWVYARLCVPASWAGPDYVISQLEERMNTDALVGDVVEHYRLTYIATYDENGDRIGPTDEWKKYRAGPKKCRTKQNPGYENVSSTGNENVSSTGNENVPMQPMVTGNENVPTLYNLSISTCALAHPDGLEAEAMFGVGHDRGPKLDGEADDLSIPEFLRRNGRAA
jgi:hypothetical protein